MSDEQTTAKKPTTFRPGTRVTLTKLKTKHSGETGTVTGVGFDRCLWVRWDGLKTSYNYHPDFLEIVLDEAERRKKGSST